MKTILVPVDLSAATAPVCGMACTLAKQIHARLILLHVVLPPFVAMNDYYAFDAGMVAEGMAAAERTAARRLNALARRCARKGITVRTVQRTDSTVATIVAQAAATKASYIVMSSHGHGSVFELIVGSTTSGVLRKALCPVLVVPIARG